MGSSEQTSFTRSVMLSMPTLKPSCYSTYYGFIRFDNSNNASLKVLILKAIGFLENNLIASNDDADEKKIHVQCDIFAKLGHFHLLLENYSKGKKI
ncbi:hypothetical protein B4U80_08249 [Leptotrombidium deliense]|uniref:Uncharacterized protein n=1 Tax=Leptotrombidium deliense TaxID=299467 RepID=A0A443SKJ3_9ACAR|nr:hypothetical protein B4U80_08249 [Leptotrombidium deliense]